MYVSWEWLRQYVAVTESAEKIADRLTMSGLNLEDHGLQVQGDDLRIELEVTSNRPDCLGHLGIAREVAVLTGAQLKVPDPQPRATGPAASSLIAVAIETPEFCPQYHARVIRGVRVGPSPDWMQRRLTTIGVKCINNIVDITNYVLFECGQPLHAFDLARVRGQRIIVRRARPGEKLQAINHVEYTLQPTHGVIADAERPVALAGVMGGADTEITEATRDVLIEAASFAPLSIRDTARALGLHSDSSYRFERALDPRGPDWASRRCCELILELAGGELCTGSVVAGAEPPRNQTPIVLRPDQFRRVLGIDIPLDRAIAILEALGLERVAGGKPSSPPAFLPPSFRRDLTREIDLIEEVARMHGYDHIPDDHPVPLRASSKTTRERVVGRVQETLTAAGFCETITMAFITENLRSVFQPRGDRPPLSVVHNDRKQENLLRQSLIPSLLWARRENERRGQFQTQFFELAKVYLAADPKVEEAAAEPWQIGLVSGRGFYEVKGVVETLAERVQPQLALRFEPCTAAHFTPGRGTEVWLGDRLWGWFGELARSHADRLGLRDPVNVAELSLHPLLDAGWTIPLAKRIPQYQGTSRDLNFILDETVTWSAVEQAVRQAAGPHLEAVAFGGQYRGQQIPANKKSYVVTLHYRSAERTLTSDEVETAQQAVIQACQTQLAATLR